MNPNPNQTLHKSYTNTQTTSGAIFHANAGFKIQNPVNTKQMKDRNSKMSANTTQMKDPNSKMLRIPGKSKVEAPKALQIAGLQTPGPENRNKSQ